MQEANKTRLLCPTVCCCPEISLKGRNFIIKDDYEGEIKIPKKKIAELISKLDELLGLPRSGLDN